MKHNGRYWIFKNEQTKKYKTPVLKVVMVALRGGLPIRGFNYNGLTRIMFGILEKWSLRIGNPFMRWLHMELGV